MRIALYARVSTEEQKIHGLSIEAQLAALREYAGDQSVGEYVDAGISGRISIKKRPELQRLLRDVEAGKVDLVAFCKLDRWTRNIREYYKAQDVLDAHNVAWKALHEDYETQTAAGRLKVNIMLAVAQDEADRTSERVKAVFAEKRKRGELVNGRTPFGIDYTDHKLVPNSDAEKVKEMFAAYIATRSANKVAAMSTFSRRSAKQLLQNEKYVAAGIISRETFDAVQTIMQQREQRHARTGRVYLFSGLLYCPVCGYKLTVHTRTVKGVDYIYYRCDQHDRLRRCTWNGSVREEVCEDYLKKKILRAVKDYNVKITKKQKKPVDVSALQRKLDKLTDLYLSDMIEREEYDRRAEPLRDAIKTAKATPKEADTASVISAMASYDGLSKAARKAFWSALVKRIAPTETGDNFDLILL